MTARLVITNPAPLRGTAFPVAGERTVVGRGSGCDVRIADPLVSQCHAALVRRGARTVLEDLGSRNGTVVNGSAVVGARVLRHGDVIGFGRVEVRFDEAGPGERWEATGFHEPVREPASHGPGRVDYSVGQQRAGMLNNVARDQYIHQVVHRRDGFLREIAATRTKATRLVWTGLALVVVGFGLFASMVLGFLGEVSRGLSDPWAAADAGFGGPDVGGLPLGLLGWAVAALGSVLLVVGIVLHVVATARRRRVDREYPARC